MREGNNNSFGSKIGAVLVAAGSAIGLGSIWRFPYIAGENGGGAFVLLYLICVLLLGIPVMLSEFAIGTHTRKGPVKAYEQFSKWWKPLGYNSIIVSTLISGFYYIVAGWSLYYFVASINGTLYSGEEFHSIFENFCASWQEPFYTMLFILVTHIIVARGVRKGLERTAEWVMPILFVMMLAMALRAATMPGAREGYEFFFKPDFSKAFTVKTIVSAIGQAFFSLSIGLGCLITFSSYFKKGTNLSTTAWSSSMLTFLVAVLSGMVIFPAVFSVEGLEPTQGPTLIFETLPFVFKDMSMPEFWSATFFLLIALAALTSTITFHEVITEYFQEHHNLSRKTGATVSTAIAVVSSILCLLSGKIFDFFDMITADVLMPLGGLLTCVFAGWHLDREVFRKEISNDGTLRAPLFGVLVFLLKWVAPLLIGTTFIYNLAF
ncbi:MAG: sodium-dependent transporter [Rikenellaceae bacterium]|nr:sodium-dependent transporter [Rikenellaceae bacterium]